jgi:hypothetical protein
MLPSTTRNMVLLEKYSSRSAGQEILLYLLWKPEVRCCITRTHQVAGPVQYFVICWSLSARSPYSATSSQAVRPHFVGCPQLLIQYSIFVATMHRLFRCRLFILWLCQKKVTSAISTSSNNKTVLVVSFI